MTIEATVENSYFQTVSEMVQGLGSALIQKFLSAEIGSRVCFVLVVRSTARFTIVLDEQWAELALELRSPGVPLGPGEDFVLPRKAIKAVIAEWPDHWDINPSPSLLTHYSPDEIPHLSVRSLDLRITS